MAVVVPVFGHPDGVEHCLDALLTAAPDELVVVVDGADSSMIEAARRYGARVVSLPERRGPAAARNTGATSATSDIVLFIDSDVVVREDTVDRVSCLLLGEPGVDAVFGSYDDEPTDPEFFSQYRNLLHHWVHQHGEAEASTFWGACGAIRRNVFLESGGFDESFKEPSIEDIELGQRLARSGHTIRLDPSLRVTHLKRWTFAGMAWTDFARRAVPWTELILRNRSAANDLNLRHLDRVCVALAGLGSAAVLVAPVAPAALALAAVSALGISLVNLPFLRFLGRKRGFVFALGSAPVHGLFYVIGGIGFVVGAIRFGLRFGTRGASGTGGSTVGHSAGAGTLEAGSETSECSSRPERGAR